MLRNYILTTFRIITGGSAYAFINIAGLAIALTAFILISFWVYDELSYDDFHRKKRQLYRVVENQYYANGEAFPVAVTPGPLAPYLKENFPEIINSTRLLLPKVPLRYEDRTFSESGAIADPSFFDMFSYSVVKGDPKTFLSGVNSIVITQRLVDRYFDGEDPLGKVFRIFDKDFAVTGVVNDPPENSHLNFDYVLPFDLFVKFNWDNLKNWSNNRYYTYVELQKGASPDEVNAKIKNIIQDHAKGPVTEIFLQPLSAIHLRSAFTADIAGHGSMQYVYIFSAAALFTLFIACINFMNLSTATASRRGKEIGIRRVSGASRRELIGQFFTESFVYVLLALIIALLLVQLLLPFFNELSGKNLEFLFGSGRMFIVLLFILLVTGLVSGSYPALFMSLLKPVTVLKGSFKTGKGAVIFRKVLVGTQFVISTLLIAGTLVVHHQLHFIRNKKLGFDRQNIITFQVTGSLESNFDAFKNELLRARGISGVTVASNSLTYIENSRSNADWEGKDPDHGVLLHMLSVDHDFVKTFNIEVIAGRNFSRDVIADQKAVILNEEAIRQMGMDDPLNKRLSFGKDHHRIIGIVKDFHFKSIHEKIEPLVIFINPGWYSQVFVKLDADDMPGNIASVEAMHKKLNPQYPFEYSFMDDDFSKLYFAEQRTGKVFFYFSLVAIFVSSLGLFGLVLFTTESRTKEIGVRKVMGASVSNLISLVSNDFIKLILLANLIAIPLVWYGMHQWLESFAYRVEISWQTFVAASGLSIMIAWLILFYRSFRAASVNPVNSLRNE